nr:PREDICTED: zinc finger protein jing homolog isoform X2 [Tribolium castaneum]|eukprot:XP_015834894.1 PREDICTED: zinc finger protein jing homolog isoform X2 [Tribolium castaneum]
MVFDGQSVSNSCPSKFVRVCFWRHEAQFAFCPEAGTNYLLIRTVRESGVKIRQGFNGFSGVAVLSCTDCSGSSTASSDITDPGSPFSTASSHSEDSASQSSTTKMPPTQTAHHPPWPWTTSPTEDCTSINKRSMQLEKTAFPKRLKSNEDNTTSKQSPPCLSNTSNKMSGKGLILAKADNPSPNDNNKSGNVKKTSKKPELAKQGKITEYFKSQVKVHVIKKDSASKPSVTSKFVSLVDQQTQFNGIRPPNSRSTTKKSEPTSKSSSSSRKLSHHVTVPRKILPAPSKLPDTMTINHHPPVNFGPTVTLTAVSFPPNLTYLHTKTPKPPDNSSNSIFVPQFATINPLVNRTPCLNVIQPVQKIINNFNCVKLNATVVPIVKLNTLPSRVSGFSVETVLSRPPPAQQPLQTTTTTAITTDEEEEKSSSLSPSPSPAESSDSGISIKDNLLEVEVVEEATVPPQKSPILSQPKTIRFPPAKQEVKEEGKDNKTTHSQESGLCRWAECSAQFDTSGALLEHLQIKHVISQATQEQYVCLWLGCKVHGRTSCSRSWLERHVLAHAGTKPFRCIVDGCGQRFNSQLTLERHVNGHFTSDGNQNSSAKKSTENSSVKLFKRNGKKIRFRRQPWSARMFDFIDAGIMEGLQHKLLTMTQDRTMGQIHNAGNTVNVLSQVMARRVEADGKVKFLVKWDPVGIIPDEWVTEKEYVPMKSVAISSLHPAAKDVLISYLFPSAKQERRRKPISKQQT